MDTTWVSNTAGGVFNFLYNQITGEDERVETYSSRNVLAKGVWVNDLPTNNYEPLEVSHGARAMANKYNREKDLEQKIASLKAQCNAKNKEIVCLQDKLSEVQQNSERRFNDLAKKLEDKEQLLKKAKKFVFASKGKLVKKEEEVEKLNNELRSFIEREKELKMTNALLEAHITELQEKLEKLNVQLQEREKVNTLEKANLSREIIAFKGKLSSANAELQNIVCEKSEMKTVLNSCKEREEKLTTMNASLEDHNKELQYKLEEMKNQLQEREKLHSQEKAEISQEINALKSKLTSIDDELQKTVFKKTEMMAMIQSSKELETTLKVKNALLEEQLQESDKVRKQEAQDLSREINSLKTKLHSTNVALEKTVSEKSGIVAMLKISKEREDDLEKMNTSLQLGVTELQERLYEMTDQLQEKEKVMEKTSELQQEIVALKGKLCSTNAAFQELLQSKTEMSALLDSSKEDARELEAMNTSLRLKVAELRERLEDKANQQQERKITPDREEEILTDSINPIRSFKRELSFNKVEKRNLWYSSKEDEEKNETPDEQLVVRPPEADKEKRTKKKVPMVNPFTVISEWYDNLPPPPIVLESVNKDAVQTQQTDGFSEKNHVNPFSMKAAKAAKGKGGVQLRPPSPFIPVCNVMEREVNQTCMNEAEKDLKKYIKGVNPFSSIETQGFFGKFVKWIGF